MPNIAAIVFVVMQHLAKRTANEIQRVDRVNGALAEFVEAVPSRLSTIEARLLQLERTR